jgi:uncharacterized protein YuzE
MFHLTFGCDREEDNREATVIVSVDEHGRVIGFTSPNEEEFYSKIVNVQGC